MIAAEDEAQWRTLCRVIDRPELAGDPRFATLADRKANEDALTAITVRTGRATATSTRRQRCCRRSGVAAAPVATAADLANSDYLAYRGFFTELEHPDAGRHRHPGLPIHLSRTPGAQAQRRAAIRRAQHARAEGDLARCRRRRSPGLPSSAAMATVPLPDG